MNPVPSLQPGCPWYEISQYAPPNLKWCEASLCSWITEPANTWSNLAYLIAAIVIFKMSEKIQSKTLKRVAKYSFWVGVMSFLYHASYNFFAQVLDFFGMYLITFLCLNISFIRMGWMSKEREPKYFWLSIVGALGMMFLLRYLKLPYQGIILVLVTLNLGLEIWLKRLNGARVSMKNFWWCQGAMVVAFTFSVLDAKRIFCDPENHFIQGHALWHVFASVSFVFWVLHLKQFVGKSIE
ncbi:MAG: ceramidase domain-containing protein [Xanthomonadaceae bacterium]|nr:ceramidase domain-containing protein [Xanthomonadaceae bacterium]